MKKKTNKKGILIILIVLIIICLACGTIGLLQSKKKDTPNDKKENKNYTAAYRYYIDGEEIEEMPELEKIDNDNPDFEGAVDTLNKYKFERYACTNEVTGEFDEEKWEFTPDLTNNTTCRLYFLNTIHNVTIRTSNAKLPNNNQEEIVKVELEKEGTINIIPNNGYKFEAVNCNNEVLAEYNEETKDLKISNVKKDSICTISFTISDFTAELSAQNGTVTESRKSANYGGNVQFNVTPAENYSFDKVTCTNNQNATYNEANGTITIQGLTNNTACIVEFKALKHQVRLDVINGTLANGTTNPQEKLDGQSAMFEIKANDGYTLAGADINCGTYNKNNVMFQNGYFTIPNVTENITCKVTLRESSN